jgi:GT2 family glycosyltransferase
VSSVRSDGAPSPPAKEAAPAAPAAPANPAAPAAPAVVVAVVASDPGAWFEETLSSLAAQDYPNLSVLVADVGTGQGLAPLADRVADVLPEAHLARLDPGVGYAAAANRALEMVEGATHVLLCHDDVALEPSTVRLLVEEAYRSNAGLVCPKVVMWDAPDRLLSVGLGADRLGVVYQLVQPGELDQGQHDGVREVFVAPSGATLVRTDLWRALHGFDGVGTPGEDLDLCWRAQVAGARVVAAPQARVRHLEAGAKGLRGPLRMAVGATGVAGAAGAARALGAAGAAGPAGEAGAARARALGEREAREQHRLRTLWTCYSALGLLLVAPVALAFALAETIWVLLRRGSGAGGDRDGTRGRRWQTAILPLKALAGSLSSPKALWAARQRVQRLRRTSDTTLWRSQGRGSARLRAVVLLRVEKNRELALLARGHDGIGPVVGEPSVGGVPITSSGQSVGAPVDWRVAIAVVAALSTVLLVGSRGLLSGPLPLVGQVPSGVGGVGSWWHAWWSGVGPATVGAMPAPSPGLALMALLGTLLAGSADLALHVLVLGPLVVGPVTAYLMARRFGSPRAALVAAIVYAAVPIPYNALSQGHWAGLIAYAAAPLVLGELAVLGGQAPFSFVHWDTAWGRVAVLGVSVAVGAAFAPALLVLVPVVGLGLWAGSALGGGGSRFFLASLLAVVVAWVLLLPWSFHVLSSWHALVGPVLGPSQRLSAWQVLRMHTGPYGGGVLGWAVPVVAGVALVLGRSWRLAWATRLWVVALLCMAVAWAGSRSWFPSPSSDVVLAPAAAALALAAGVGGASVEADLRGYRFGWRQLAPAVGALAVLASALPLVSWSGSGQWGLPTQGAESAFAFPDSGGYYRALWVGTRGSLPTAPEGSLGNFAFATSFNGLPSAALLWEPVGTGAVPIVARDLRWATQGATTQLGRLLSPLAIRYVVVPAGPAASQLVAALVAQTDLEQIGTGSAFLVFQNVDWAPWLWLVAGPSPARLASLVASSQSWDGAGRLERLDLSDTEPIVAGPGSGPAASIVNGSPYGTMRASLSLPSGGALYLASPIGGWGLEANGRPIAAQKAFGWATLWRLPAGRDVVVIRPSQSLGRHVLDIVVLGLWVLGLWALLYGTGTKLRRGLYRAAIELADAASGNARLGKLSSPWDEEGTA